MGKSVGVGVVARVVAARVEMWSNVSAMSDRPIEPPDEDRLVAELKTIRHAGIVKLNRLELPALVQAARAAGDADPDQKVGAPLIEEVIRRGLADLGGGTIGECATVLLGLEPGTRGLTPAELRRAAAEVKGISVDRFRREPEIEILTQLAQAIVRRALRHHERLAHLALERRLPPTSRLAVAWLERFEAYYRVWTPVTGLGGDLAAYRSTLLEEDRPYDQAPGTDGPDDPGYTQEFQAAGYVTTALWHYTCVLVEVQRYLHQYGGMWLLSDAKAEQELADAVYRISWHTPNNERDDSHLRGLYEQAGGELHPFRVLLTTDRIAKATEQEWHEWASTCRCTWSVEDEVDSERFPTHRHHGGIDPKCQLHAVISACNDYCTLVDDDWRRVADWYRLPVGRVNSVNDRRLYDKMTVRVAR